MSGSWSQLATDNPVSPSPLRWFAPTRLTSSLLLLLGHPSLPSSHQAPTPVSSHSSTSLYIERSNFQLLHLGCLSSVPIPSSYFVAGMMLPPFPFSFSPTLLFFTPLFLPLPPVSSSLPARTFLLSPPALSPSSPAAVTSSPSVPLPDL